MKPLDPMSHCPCGSGRSLDDCCGHFLAGLEAAPTAEALMRSRYVAYALGYDDYVLATWHVSTRPCSLELGPEPRPSWIGLSIKRHEQYGEDRAVVEFVARYKVGGRAHRMQESSRFVRENDRWFYVDGEVAPQP